MRKLMWFTLGFAAACIPCAYFWLVESLLIPAAILLVMCVTALFLGKKIKLLFFAAALCAGCAAGLLWFQFYAGNYLSVASSFHQIIVDVTACCTDYSYETKYGTAVEAVIKIDEKPVRTKLYLDEKIQAEPGDLLQGRFEFQVTTPDGADEITAQSGKGIFLLAYQRDAISRSVQEERPIWTIPARLRHHLLSVLDAYFPTDAAPFAKALLLGDRTDIDYETNTAFKLSGISHVIAVSGLHVTILFTLINMICLKQRHLVAILAIPVLLLFAVLAGSSPSIMRACIMQCLMMVAMLLNREYDGPTELAFSCLVMLLFNPLVITSISFQLSVGCMVGIFLFSKRIGTYLTERFVQRRSRFLKMKRWIISSVSVTLSAMTVTTPLVAYYFGVVSLVGILTNLLVLWVISFIFYGIILVCVFSFFWTGGASMAATLIAWPIRYVLLVSKILAKIPLSAVYTASPYIVIWLIFCYVLLVIFLLSKKRKPVQYLFVAVLSLSLALCASWMEPLTDGCRMTVLNVGQGQCILLQSDGKTYLVDCGGSNGEEAADTAAEYLLSQGISRLDGVFLTHFDSDHSGGMEALLSRVHADILFAPSCADESGVLARLTPFVSQVQEVKEDMILTYADTVFSIFAPVLPNSGNESSLAILFRRKEYDILITGDRSGFGERMLLRTGRIPEVDVLVAGHHGSHYSTSDELLQVAKPKMAIISVGENNFGHPAQEVLDKFAAIQCIVYRTDIHGNVTVRR